MSAQYSYIKLAVDDDGLDEPTKTNGEEVPPYHSENASPTAEGSGEPATSYPPHGLDEHSTSSPPAGLLPLPVTACLDRRVNLPFHRTVRDCLKTITIAILSPIVVFAMIAWIAYVAKIIFTFMWNMW